jgi:hypothetical protein
MKKTILLLAIGLMCANASTHAQHSPLRIEYVGNESSTHYHHPVQAKIENPTDRAIPYEVPIGTVYRAKDPAYQDYIVVEHLLAEIPPHSSQTLNISAMCMEPSDLPQSDAMRYELIPPKPSELLRYVTFIQGKMFSKGAVQDGLWKLVENDEDVAIYGWNSDEINEISRWLANEMGIELSEDQEFIEPEHINGTLGEKSVKISGSFTVASSRNSDVVAGLFDTDKRLVREFYRNPNTPAGRHKITYAYDGKPYLGAEYVHLLIVNGKISLELPMDLRED